MRSAVFEWLSRPCIVQFFSFNHQVLMEDTLSLCYHTLTVGFPWSQSIDQLHDNLYAYRWIKIWPIQQDPFKFWSINDLLHLQSCTAVQTSHLQPDRACIIFLAGECTAWFSLSTPAWVSLAHPFHSLDISSFNHEGSALHVGITTAYGFQEAMYRTFPPTMIYPHYVEKQRPSDDVIKTGFI